MKKIKNSRVALAVVGSILLVGAAITAIAAGGHSGGDQDIFSRIKQLNHIAVCAGIIHCNARVVVDGHGAPKTTSLPSGYGPAQFLGAYGLTGIAPVTSSNGAPPIIGIVDAYNDPYIASDIATYSKTFNIPGLPACTGSITAATSPCLEKINQNGGTQYPSTNSGWALEISLDTEIAHAVCQNCKILLVEANSASYADLMAAVDRARIMGAKYISNSYGSSEFSGESAYDGYFNHPGVAFTFSAGDGGYGVEYPAASQYVTAVGGTTLAVTSTNNAYHYVGEKAWNGTGSGCSAYETKPAWQADTAGCARRTIADVSADADPSTGAAVYDSVRYSGQRGWFQVGGTSLSSPIIAATYALASDVPATGTASYVPYAEPYATTGGLHDVTLGSNGTCGSYLCTAGVGYDGPTGLGSPQGTTAF